jgi:hypothetical protein
MDGSCVNPVSALSPAFQPRSASLLLLLYRSLQFQLPHVFPGLCFERRRDIQKHLVSVTQVALARVHCSPHGIQSVHQHLEGIEFRFRHRGNPSNRPRSYAERCASRNFDRLVRRFSNASRKSPAQSSSSCKSRFDTKTCNISWSTRVAASTSFCAMRKRQTIICASVTIRSIASSATGHSSCCVVLGAIVRVKADRATLRTPQCRRARDAFRRLNALRHCRACAQVNIPIRFACGPVSPPPIGVHTTRDRSRRGPGRSAVARFSPATTRTVVGLFLVP